MSGNTSDTGVRVCICMFIPCVCWTLMKSCRADLGSGLEAAGCSPERCSRESTSGSRRTSLVSSPSCSSRALPVGTHIIQPPNHFLSRVCVCASVASLACDILYLHGCRTCLGSCKGAAGESTGTRLSHTEPGPDRKQKHLSRSSPPPPAHWGPEDLSGSSYTQRACRCSQQLQANAYTGHKVNETGS